MKISTLIGLLSITCLFINFILVGVIYKNVYKDGLYSVKYGIICYLCGKINTNWNITSERYKCVSCKRSESLSNIGIGKLNYWTRVKEFLIIYNNSIIFNRIILLLYFFIFLFGIFVLVLEMFNFYFLFSFCLGICNSISLIYNFINCFSIYFISKSQQSYERSIETY